jgi:hypothetical protein
MTKFKAIGFECFCSVQVVSGVEDEITEYVMHWQVCLHIRLAFLLPSWVYMNK